MGRSYTDKDLKILWGADARCAFPGCRAPLIVPPSDDDPTGVIGKIAHIVAHSDDGPRGDPTFPASMREDPENLILLCPTHHDLVDLQPNTFTSGDLRTWKEEHHAWVQQTLADAVVRITFKELELVTQALEAAPASMAPLTLPVPPAQKMQYNGLSVDAANYFRIGQLRFGDVEAYVAEVSSIDPDFGEKLKAGFRQRYDELWERDLRGDDLYVALADWAAGGRGASQIRQAAGVAVLSYLFHICDVFETEPSE